MTRYRVDAECAGAWRVIGEYESMTQAELVRTTLENSGVTTRLVLVDATPLSEGGVTMEVPDA